MDNRYREAAAEPHSEMAADQSLDERLWRVLEAGQRRASDTAVFVLANLKSGEGGADITDVETEFLSEAELDQIVGGFRAAGFYCDPFTDEVEFCRWASAEGGQRFPLPNRAVYTIAQPGRGASRHAPLAGIAELFGFTLLSPPAYEACLSNHKAHATLLMAAAGVPTPETWTCDPQFGWIGSEPPAGAVVIAKPCLESASIGVDSQARFEYGPATRDRVPSLARTLNQPMVVQRFIPGWEVEVAVINDGEAFALDPVGIAVDGAEHLGQQYLDYATVYRDGYDFFDFAAREPEISAQLRKHAARAATALGLRGVSRFDFRVTGEGEPFAMDMAGKPHLTRHSSVAFRFAAMGHAYGDVFSALVGSAELAGGFSRGRG